MEVSFCERAHTTHKTSKTLDHYYIGLISLGIFMHTLFPLATSTVPFLFLSHQNIATQWMILFFIFKLFCAKIKETREIRYICLRNGVRRSFLILLGIYIYFLYTEHSLADSPFYMVILRYFWKLFIIFKPKFRDFKAKTCIFIQIFWYPKFRYLSGKYLNFQKMKIEKKNQRSSWNGSVQYNCITY